MSSFGFRTKWNITLQFAVCRLVKTFFSSSCQIQSNVSEKKYRAIDKKIFIQRGFTISWQDTIKVHAWANRLNEGTAWPYLSSLRQIYVQSIGLFMYEFIINLWTLKRKYIGKAYVQSIGLCVLFYVYVIGVGRGGGGGQGGPGPPIIWEGGQHTLWPPPPIIHPHFPSISIWNRKKNHKRTKLKGKIIINATLIWFEGTGKTIPLNSILEFSIISDFKMRNVIIWHWFIKNLLGTWHRNDVDATSLRRIDVITMSCACLEFGPLNILKLPTPMYVAMKLSLKTTQKKCSIAEKVHSGPQWK